VELKNKQNRFGKTLLRVVQTGLLAVLLCLTFQSAPMAVAANLPLDVPSRVDEPDTVPTFDQKYIKEKWTSNIKLLNDLFTKSLLFRIINVAKYVLGGLFMVFLSVYVISFLTSNEKEEGKTAFKKQMTYVFVGFLLLALAQPLSSAVNVWSLGDKAGGLINEPDAVRQSAELLGFNFRTAAKFIQYLLGALALIMIGISAFRILAAVGSEEDIKSARKTMVWAVFGLLLATGAGLFVDRVIAPEGAASVIGGSLDPQEQSAQILMAGQTHAQVIVISYVKYFQTFLGAGAIFMLFLAGFKMIAAAGNEEVITKQRKIITWIFLGLAVVLISEVFVSIFMPEKGGVIVTPGTQELRSFSAQIGGITNFLLTFSGGLSVLALIVGALYVSTAVANPEQAEKGKKILLAAALGLIVTISAYAVVNTILSGKAAPSSGVSIEVSI
jgi:hypothetical protein